MPVCKYFIVISIGKGFSPQLKDCENQSRNRKIALLPPLGNQPRETKPLLPDEKLPDLRTRENNF
jgi:hypothetical protein